MGKTHSESYRLTSCCSFVQIKMDKWRLTPGASIRYYGLDLDCYSWERSDGDGEDETHRESHQPDLITKHETNIINTIQPV